MKKTLIASCTAAALAVLLIFCAQARAQDFSQPRERLAGFVELVKGLGKSTGAYQLFSRPEALAGSAVERSAAAEIARAPAPGWMKLIMIAIGGALIYLAIKRKVEPLMLLPIGFGAILANIPLAGMSDAGGLLQLLFNAGIATGALPLILFLCVGAMLDLGPLISSPRTAFLGAAGSLGIFAAVLAALALARYAGLDFSLRDACAVGSAAAASGPLAIFVSAKLSPALSGPIAIAAYAGLALAPLMQPQLMRLVCTEDELRTQMELPRAVSRGEKIAFALVLMAVVVLLVPAAAAIVGMIVLGNIMRESGVTDRLLRTSQGELANIATMALGLGIAAGLTAEKFLRIETLAIILISLVSVAISTLAGLLLGKLIHRASGGRLNPIIGAAAIAAIPAMAKIAAAEGERQNPSNFLMMQALAVNIAGLIGAVIAAGVLLAIFQ